MQHDTSPHDLHLGGTVRRAQIASLVLGYPRMLFCPVYPQFRRFECNAFLTKALRYMDPARPRRGLLWKLATEATRPLAREPIWEFIERGGSYAAPRALLVLTRGPARPRVESTAHLQPVSR